MKRLIFSLCLSLLLIGCQTASHDESQNDNIIISEQNEIEPSALSFNDVPLTLIESHRVHPTASNVRLLFANHTTPKLIGDTAFRALTYLPEQAAMYYLNQETLAKATSANITSIGEINFDDYSMIEYGLENEAILYSTTTFNESTDVTFELFIQTPDTHFLQVAPRALYFALNDSGTHLYYINEKEEAIDYEVASQIEKIIATGYHRLFYLNDLDALLLQKSDKSVDLYDKNNITPFANHMQLINNNAVKVSGDYLYFIDHQVGDAFDSLGALLATENHQAEVRGELYRLSLATQQIENISTKEIQQFVVQADDIYFVTSDGQLYVTNNSTSSKLIADQVISLASNETSLYYVTSNGDLVELINGVGTHLSTQINLDYLELIQQSVQNDELIYLSTAGTLTYNGKTFDDLCESAAYEQGILAAYTLNDQVYYINPQTEESLLLLEETSAYDEIYFGNQLLKYREFQYENEPVTNDPVTLMETNDNQAEELIALAGSKSFSDAFVGAHFYSSSSYIIPQGLDTYLTVTDLAYYTHDELALIRNEIFARNGYIFDSEFYQAYFNSKDWYQGVSKNVSLNEVAQRNVELIQALEKGELSIPDEWIGSPSYD